jgi:acetyl esterase/lipase
MLRSQKALGEYLTLPKLTLEEIAHNTAIVAEEYKYGEERGQYILYFAPVIRAKELVIVYIHGGGWIAGSPERYKFIGQKFAEMGYHTVSIGYRHSPANKYPAQAEDVFAGYCKGLITLMGKGVKTQHAVVVGS